MSVVLSLAGLSACVPPSAPATQIQSSNPSVTYKYIGDQELIQANQKAMQFCTQYRTSARTVSITDTQDGGKVAVFECAGAPQPLPPQQVFNPNLGYSFRTDQELLDGARNAETFCASTGNQRAVSSIATGVNGSRTLTFQCVPR